MWPNICRVVQEENLQYAEINVVGVPAFSWRRKGHQGMGENVLSWDKVGSEYLLLPLLLLKNTCGV